MGAREDERRRRAKGRDIRVRVGMDLRRLREDTGLTLRAVAAAAGISAAHLCGIELGQSAASNHVLVSVADVLGADLSVRFYPGSGPRIHDHVQARIVESLITAAKPRWQHPSRCPSIDPPAATWMSSSATNPLDASSRRRCTPTFVGSNNNFAGHMTRPSRCPPPTCGAGSRRPLRWGPCWSFGPRPERGDPGARVGRDVRDRIPGQDT